MDRRCAYAVAGEGVRGEEGSSPLAGANFHFRAFKPFINYSARRGAPFDFTAYANRGRSSSLPSPSLLEI